MAVGTTPGKVSGALEDVSEPVGVQRLVTALLQAGPVHFVLQLCTLLHWYDDGL